MKYVFILIFVIYSTTVFGQFYKCDSLFINSTCGGPFETEGIKTTFDFIKKFHPKQIRFYSDRADLKSINLWLNVDTFMIFNKDSDEIKIIFGKKKFNPDNIFYPKTNDESFSRIREYSNDTPFGVISEDTTVTYIKSITINSRSIPKHAFIDLLNPNRYKTFFSVKPIKVYKSKNNKYIFIYIFGSVDNKLMTFNESIEFSYMAKIIITSKGYYVDRIVEPGIKLQYFGFGECPYFIGF